MTRFTTLPAGPKIACQDAGQGVPPVLGHRFPHSSGRSMPGAR
ncbi:hypothetical protein HNP84_007587 [Thermocatellispora tengchongensis]|uniref:Uncharacterized protein n=1 Tax=Thermocatellispora tengchongensis TaxID=1073253 RepID=A0A840P8Y1_9ACTN|nr:hypothetical protein [Thermocatellispora tengchongensis]